MTTPGSSTDSSRKHARYFVLVLVAGLLVLFLYMISGIVAGLVAVILLWVMTRWIYDWLLKRTRGRQGMAAGLAVLATLLLVIVPLAVIILIMTADAMSLAGEIQSWIPAVEAKINEWTRLISRNGLSLFGYDFSPEEISSRIVELSTRAGQFLLTLTQRTASSIVSLIIMLFVALYTLYFFYLDGDRFIEWLKSTLPLENQHSSRLIDGFFKSSIATLKMIGVIGVVQGLAAGVAFFIIGVPAPFFLTVLTIFSTVIPTVGPGLVIIPVSIGLFIAGQTGWAIALLVWGAVVIGNIDNILRPYLVHKAIRLHQLVLFAAMIGGIAKFGFFGVLVGPVIAALLNAGIDIYKDVYPRPADADRNEPDTA